MIKQTVITAKPGSISYHMVNIKQVSATVSQVFLSYWGDKQQNPPIFIKMSSALTVTDRVPLICAPLPVRKQRHSFSAPSCGGLMSSPYNK